MIRELERELPEATLDSYKQYLQLCRKAIAQKRKDKNKVYSLHKPFTGCIAKGKAHKPYEFGNKIGLLVHGSQKLILAVGAFMGNPHDSKTIGPLLEHLEQMGETKPTEVIYDRGGRGKKKIQGVKITTPTKPQKSDSANKKRRLRRRFRRRAGIEAIIGHLKTGHRMAQNYLHGEDSPQINAMLAAAAWNMTKWMERVTRVGDAFCQLIEKWADFLAFKPLKWAS